MALKFLGWDPSTLTYSILLDIFNVSSMEKRREVADIAYLFRIVRGLEDNDYLREKLFLRVSGRTRQHELFYSRFARLEVVFNSPLNRMTASGNNHCEEIDFFCSSLKEVRDYIFKVEER